MTKNQLIVMLTYNDFTVDNAAEIFDQAKHSQAKLWGFKDKSLPLDDMRQLFDTMKAHGKTTFLEVVDYTEEGGLKGAQTALDCGCDILMGTVFYESINDFCKANNIKYMPFVGKLSGRPSVLGGSIQEIIDQGQNLLEKGVYGFDLLGYRYTGDAHQLNKAFVEAIDAPVCLAGSINSYQRLDEVKETQPWAFTIGSAFFDKEFGQEFAEQIDLVCDYMKD